MKYANHRVLPLSVLLALGWLSVFTATALAQSIVTPQGLTPALSASDVRIGMKGYGLTVFHGTKIEPFNVEVVSIVPNATPARSVIWVRCTDARMIESGPVQGMSGSPIYLWDADETKELGKGGKLIGAFAFGYTESQQCLVGVQPIEYMRESATRVPEADDKGNGSKAAGGSTRHLIELLQNVNRMQADNVASPMTAVRNKALLDVVQRASGRAGVVEEVAGDVGGPHTGTHATGMMLPITLGSAASARVFGPLLEPMGLMAVATDSAPIAGAPPKEVDVESVSIEPGSVLAVPLAFGDLDMSASGTVTEVLPGGEVLAFGHPMFGLGAAQVPMATGYVHFVMPRRSISFKNTGSLVPMGTLVRDEGAAVVGVSDVRYTTAPVKVNLNMLDQPTRTYNYTVVNEPTLSATLVANVVYNSLDAVHGMPTESTIRIRATMRFSGDRELNVDTVIPEGNAIYPVMELLPPMSVLVQNAYESLEVESVDVTVDVEEGVRLSNIEGARLDRAEVAPGESVGILLDLQHYGGKSEQRRITFQLPDDLDEGDYPLIISGANNYASMMISSKPYLTITRNVDDLVGFMRETMSYRTDAIYATLQLPDAGLAVGRAEMRKLPSSRAAMLTSPTTTDTMPFPILIDQTYDSDTVVQGQVNFTISVRKP